MTPDKKQPVERHRIIIVEEGPETAWQTRAFLEGTYNVELLDSPDEACARLQRSPSVHAVLLHVRSADTFELGFIRSFRRILPVLKVIVLLPSDHADQVVKAVRLGADTCVWKPFTANTLHRALKDCLATSPEPDTVASLENQSATEELEGGGFYVMASPQMRNLRAQVEKVARIDVPVLCLGESGTGKEVITRLIHRLSPRAQRPFLKVNCAAMPSELLESELFGYERGAFTGAVRAKPGKFEVCNHGTLFLDEIGEMPPALQAKLLHVLQDREFSRLGGSLPVKVDVRVLAATNVNIREAIQAKIFRADLYYRLSTFVFCVPPLRDRPEDIPVLLKRNMQVFAERLNLPLRPISDHLLERCLRYNWPGNVRELENFVKRYLICGEEAMTFSASPQLTEGDGTLHPVHRGASGAGDLKAHIRELRNGAEASAMSKALEEKHWNRKQAAKALNISYKSLLSKIRLYGLDRGAEVQPVGKGSGTITNSGNTHVPRVRCAGEPL